VLYLSFFVPRIFGTLKFIASSTASPPPLVSLISTELVRRLSNTHTTHRSPDGKWLLAAPLIIFLQFRGQWRKKAPQDDPQTQIESPPSAPIPSQFGLQVLHEPLVAPQESQRPNSGDAPDAPRPALIDIIFVHGLDGSSRGTWTHPESQKLWPTWLPEKIENIRIATFGYDANWNPAKANNDMGIADFARELLVELALHYAKFNDVLSTGSHLLIFRLPLSLWHTAWVDLWSKRFVGAGRIQIDRRLSMRLIPVQGTPGSSKM
jgi:hypothetical protein